MWWVVQLEANRIAHWDLQPQPQVGTVVERRVTEFDENVSEGYPRSMNAAAMADDRGLWIIWHTPDPEWTERVKPWRRRHSHRAACEIRRWLVGSGRSFHGADTHAPSPGRHFQGFCRGFQSCGRVPGDGCGSPLPSHPGAPALAAVTWPMDLVPAGNVLTQPVLESPTALGSLRWRATRWSARCSPRRSFRSPPASQAPPPPHATPGSPPTALPASRTAHSAPREP